jgi:hypothetical protein
MAMAMAMVVLMLPSTAERAGAAEEAASVVAMAPGEARLQRVDGA